MKNLTITKIKENARQTLLNTMLEKFGDSAIQTDSKTIAIEVDKMQDGTPIYIRVDLTTTEPIDRKTTKKEFKAYNPIVERENYLNRQQEKENKKQLEKQARTKEKIAKLEKQLNNM